MPYQGSFFTVNPSQCCQIIPNINIHLAGGFQSRQVSLFCNLLNFAVKLYVCKNPKNFLYEKFLQKMRYS